MAVKLGDAVLYLSADDSKLKRTLQTSKQEAETWGGALEGVLMGAGMGAFTMATGVISDAAGRVAGLFMDAVEAGSNLEETNNKIAVLFGDSAGAIQAWADTSVEAFGQSKQKALDAAATFGIFGQAAGLTGPDMADFSERLTILASDLASFHNTTADQAIGALGSALRGESEPMRNFGVLLNEGAIKAKALELGIWDGEGALTSQQKILATYQLILDQTTVAQGDFARTSEGVANQQRILTEKFNDTIAAIGERLQPLIQPLLNKFNDMADVVLPKVVEAVGAVVDRMVIMGQAFQLWYATYGAEWERNMNEMWNRLRIPERVQEILDSLNRLTGWFSGSDSASPFSWIKTFSALLTAFVDTGLHQVQALLSSLEIGAQAFKALISGDFDNFARLNLAGGMVQSAVGPSQFAWQFQYAFQQAMQQMQSVAPQPVQQPNGPRSARGAGSAINIGITVNAQGDGLAVASAARDGLLSALQAAGM